MKAPTIDELMAEFQQKNPHLNSKLYQSVREYLVKSRISLVLAKIEKQSQIE